MDSLYVRLPQNTSRDVKTVKSDEKMNILNKQSLLKNITTPHKSTFIS